jgi:hypothetical protein
MLLGVILAFALQTASPVETIVTDSMSHIDTARQAVARTSEEWAALWRQHAGDAPAPKVDLAARTVVAVFLGARMSGGFRVEITGTRQHGGALVVEWRERTPAPGGVTASVITTPAHIASVPRFDGEIRFEKAGQ